MGMSLVSFLTYSVYSETVLLSYFWCVGRCTDGLNAAVKRGGDGKQSIKH